MVLCVIGEQYGFFAIWSVLSVVGLVSMMLMSSLIFYPYYQKPTFEMWQYKSNPKYPSPGMVKKEIIHTCKGLSVGVLCPAFAICAKQWGEGLSQAYCGLENPDAMPLLVQAAIIIVFTDFVEYAYHWLGHYFTFMWEIHRHHHKFYNPTPFAVIADEYLDQFVRSLPLCVLPWMMPINIDLLFGIFTVFFYGYGVYLHMGYESPKLSAHNPVANTSYHHYIHHAISIKGRPIYTGFFVKIWDQIFGSLNPNPCSCVECRPKRTKAEWDALDKPDYSVLLSPQWWMSCGSKAAEDDANEKAE